MLRDMKGKKTDQVVQWRNRINCDWSKRWVERYKNEHRIKDRKINK